MDSGMRPEFVNVIRRLDQIQKEQSQMFERLDTIQNILESQSRKQSSLEDQLSEVTIKIGHEKIFMRDQLRDAQSEILERLQYIQPLMYDASHGNISSLLDTGQLSHQGTQTVYDGSDVKNEVKEKFQILEQKTELIKDEVTKTAQTCQRLTGQLETLLERNITSHVTQEKENLETSVAEIRSIPDVIRGHTKTELVWLLGQVNTRLSETDTVVNEKLSMLDGDIIKQVDQTRQMTEMLHNQKTQITETLQKYSVQITAALDKQRTHITEELDKYQGQITEELDKCQGQITEELDKCQGQITEELDKYQGQIIKKLDNYQGQMTEIITKTTETVKEDILKHMTSCEKTRADNWQKMTVEFKHVKASVTSLRQIADKIETNMSAAVQKLDILETSVTAGQQTVREDLVAIKQQHDDTTEKLEETIQEVKGDIDRVKRQVIAVIEKESQLVRDRIQGPLPSLGKYTFDFYIENFKTLVRSRKSVFSLPWYINEMRSCVKCLAIFSNNGDLSVWLVHGRHPREVGLQPCTTNGTLKVKATICDISKKTLPDVELGEQNMSMSESGIPCNGGCGCEIGVTSCDDLITKGYGDKEGYWYKSVLIRFEVTVC